MPKPDPVYERTLGDKVYEGIIVGLMVLACVLAGVIVAKAVGRWRPSTSR